MRFYSSNGNVQVFGNFPIGTVHASKPGNFLFSGRQRAPPGHLFVIFFGREGCHGEDRSWGNTMLFGNFIDPIFYKRIFLFLVPE